VSDGLGNGLGYRSGQGWDVHRLVEGRRLMLGGVEIPHDRGELGHSDGDVLIHALIDAVLGACALGDIGSHFPPSDPAWKDADSGDLLKRTMELARGAGFEIVNADCTVILERPKLGPHRDGIRASLAGLLGIGLDRVSVKAKTYEGLGEVGRGEAVEATAIVLMGRRYRA
jgi:2-C-methyl-D-erythritol 2,4-cyclodiphosphate synthase